MTPFDILDTSPNATDAQIKQAYLKKVRDYPPDHAPLQFQRIREAYEQVQTEKKRLEYRLFYTDEPDVRDIVGHLLQQRGTVQRPDKAAFRQALKASLQARQNT